MRDHRTEAVRALQEALAAGDRDTEAYNIGAAQAHALLWIGEILASLADRLGAAHE